MANRTAAVITVSDKCARGERVDASGPALCGLLRDGGWEVVRTAVIPDEMEEIQEELIRCADEEHIQLVLTTGGTGFSPRDVTPEAALAVIERAAPGLPEAMRSESMRITPRGCLSRGIAGIRGGTLIVNLPGSEKAARENFAAVQSALGHGVDMLCSAGSADCAAPVRSRKKAPSMDQWLREAKAGPDGGKTGMYLTHNGVVRATPRRQVREGAQDAAPVRGMRFGYDPAKVEAAVEAARRLEGIFHVRVWLNEGELDVGDDIMYVLVGGDIRPHVVDALQFLVEKLKAECVTETEL